MSPTLMFRSFRFIHYLMTAESQYRCAQINYLIKRLDSSYRPTVHKDVVPLKSFETADKKTKEVYLDMLRHYKVKEVHRRGHVEFINAALKYMKDFGVEKDLEVYKALVDVMPKGKFVPENFLQAEFMHYPKQQDCIIGLLEQMDYYGVMPDPELGEILINVFGERGFPVRRFMRMLYWKPKLANISPWPIPRDVPKEPFELAMLAIERITSVDPATKISVLSTRSVEDAVDDTWIISGQSIEQQNLINKHKPDKPVYIEGAYTIWLRNRSVYYFVLRGDAEVIPVKDIDIDDVGDLNVDPANVFFTPPDAELEPAKSVHEQEDGTYYAVCATGTSTKDSLLSWVRLLQKENPKLGEIPVLFKFYTPPSEVAKINESKETGIKRNDNTEGGDQKG